MLPGLVLLGAIPSPIGENQSYVADRAYIAGEAF
jgi:hypothetical protein